MHGTKKKRWLLGAASLLALLGTALSAHAINPDGGGFTFFASTPMNSSYGSGASAKRVNWIANVNNIGCGMDTTSVQPSTTVHTFHMEMIGQCLGSGGQFLSRNGASHPLTSADDLVLTCWPIRGDAMLATLQITN